MPTSHSTPSPCWGLTPHFPVTSDPDEDPHAPLQPQGVALETEELSAPQLKHSGDDTLGGESLAVGFPCSRKLISDHNFISFRFEGYFF